MLVDHIPYLVAKVHSHSATPCTTHATHVQYGSLMPFANWGGEHKNKSVKTMFQQRSSRLGVPILGVSCHTPGTAGGPANSCAAGFCNGFANIMVKERLDMFLESKYGGKVTFRPYLCHRRKHNACTPSEAIRWEVPCLWGSWAQVHLARVPPLHQAPPVPDPTLQPAPRHPVMYVIIIYPLAAHTPTHKYSVHNTQAQATVNKSQAQHGMQDGCMYPFICAPHSQGGASTKC